MTYTERIEAMARALCNSVEADVFDELSERSIVKAAYRQQARAADTACLAALEKQKGEMCAAALHEIIVSAKPGADYVEVPIKQITMGNIIGTVWRAMWAAIPRQP
jgi:hypothetical protein